MSKYCLLCIFFVLSGLYPYAQDLPFDESFYRAQEAFEEGSYTSSLYHLKNIESYFSEEEDFKNRSFQKEYLRFYAMSALATADYQLAQTLFEQYFSSYFERRHTEQSLLLGYLYLLYATDSNELFEQYADLFSDFCPEHREQPYLLYFRVLKQLRTGAIEKAIAQYHNAIESNCKDLHFRLFFDICEQLMEENRTEELFHFSQSSPVLDDRAYFEPEYIYTAIKLAGFLFEHEQWDKSREILQLIPSPRKCIQRINYVDEDNCNSGINRQFCPFGRLFDKQFQAKQKAVMETVKNDPGYFQNAMFRLGLCHFKSGNFPEAWVINRFLTQDTSLPSSIREQSAYYWVVSSIGLEDWGEVISLCSFFVETFPESELMPKLLYLLARSYSEQSEWVEANQVLTELIRRFPMDVNLARWLFTRGVNFKQSGDIDSAIVDFCEIDSLENAAETISIKARYMNAVCLAEQYHYNEAIDIFSDLILRYNNRPLIVDLKYQLAFTYYSKQDYKSAYPILEKLLKDDKDHPRINDAIVLLGDVFHADGQLGKAVNQYKTLKCDAPSSYVYGVFKTGELYKEMKRYEEMVLHYKSYLDESFFEGKTRQMEAVYWCSKALEKLDRRKDAAKVLLDGIHEHGNNPDIAEIDSILHALKKVADFGLLSDGISFEGWFEQELDRSLNTEQWTMYSRLLDFKSNQCRLKGNTDAAESILLSLANEVDHQFLDAEILGRIGLVLAKRGFESASLFLDQLTTSFPNSDYVAYAWYGYGFLEKDKGHITQAINLLNLVEKSYPQFEKTLEVKLLKGKLLLQKESSDEAIEVFNDLLKLKQGRGRIHVEALRGIALSYEAKDLPLLAIPYWQRIFTLYCAYQDFVPESYYHSAKLFQSLDRHEDASRTCHEFLGLRQYAHHELTNVMKTLLQELQPRTSDTTGENS